MAKAKVTKFKLDMMSVTVLLVMSVFGGIVGYYLGKSTSTPQTVMMKETGSMMMSTGKMVEERGTRYRDTELTEKGKTLNETGSMMVGKATMMMEKGY